MNHSNSQLEKLLSSESKDVVGPDEQENGQEIEFGVTEFALRQYNIYSGCEYLFLIMSLVPSWIIFAIYGLDYFLTTRIIYFNVLLAYPLAMLLGKGVTAYSSRKHSATAMHDSNSESTPSTNPFPKTVLKSSGLFHSRPCFEGFMTPNGGDVFIPYRDIESVSVGVTPPALGASVTKVDITGTAPNGTDKGHYVKKGYPTFLDFNKTTNSFKISILGLSDPYQFQQMILAKKNDKSTVSDLISITTPK